MTVRVRLTLLYALLFLVAGAALLALSYGIVRHELPPDHVSTITAQDVRNRAQKLAATAKLDPFTRAALTDIASSSDAVIKELIDNPSGLPPEVVKPLLAELPTTVRTEALHKLTEASLLGLGAMVVVAGGLGWVVAGRLLRPIGVITGTAQRLSAHNLHERLALAGPDDELKRLGDTFDEMLGRLEAAFEGQRRFVANASHELRTPLTIMRTEIDVALRRPDATSNELRAMAETVRLTLTRADRLVTSLLALAAADHGPEVTERVDLALIARQALNHHHHQLTAKELSVSTDLQPAPVIADPGLIDRVAENLIENATIHNHDGGWIRVRTATEANSSVLDITNSGPVIETHDVDRLFEPFNRGRRTGSRTTGIGLSIVRSVIHAHRGTVFAETLPGGGLHVVARLPRDAQTLESSALG
jgi:signal transduction histidine kinase